MSKPRYMRDWIPGLERLGQQLRQNELPSELLQKALALNPWFSTWYIKRALSGIIDWLEAKNLASFLGNYPAALPIQRRVGIIAAGNIPFVGFHDVMMAVLAGHEIQVKCSHQDKVLLPWLVSQWAIHEPCLEQRISWQMPDASANFLIATGSNNSARYFEAMVGPRPHLIRKNRFSVAVLTGEESPADLLALCDDVFLYNGLGCRNVSNIVLTEGAEIGPWLDILKKNPPAWIHPLYLERVLCVYAQRKALKHETAGFPLFQLEYANQLGPVPMGIIRIVRVDQMGLGRNWYQSYADQLQCLVGPDIAFGSTQQPRIDQFADNIDTLAKLVRL